MRVPDVLKQCVVFLCVVERDGEIERVRYGGTAFFVSVPLEGHSSVIVYLVTARHNIERAARYGGLYVRINKADGTAELSEIDANWYYPESDGVDLAVLLIRPLPQEFQVRAIGIELFATDQVIEEQSIGIGDEIIISGLFTQRHGAQQNLPIVRSGIIASMPDEPLEDRDTGIPYHAYLAEVRSIGGLSGSPVFVILEPGRVRRHEIRMERRVFLLGVIRGHWDYRRSQTLVDFAGDELEYVNMGIAIVTPIQELITLLNTEELVRTRREIEARLAAENAPTPDNSFSDLV